MTHQRKIAVIGLGYVGLPVAVAFAKSGAPVVGFDIDRKRVDELRSGRDRTREVDFITEAGGHFELFEAKWNEVPGPDDAVNLRFARDAIGKSRIIAGSVICRAHNSYPLGDSFRVIPVNEL